jgi:phosphohistidine phosphatase
VVRVARLARQRGLMPTTVLVSASLRTRETAALFCESVRICPVEFVDRDLYLADAAALLGRIRNLPDTGGTVMLVGHNPGLEELAAALTPGHGPGHVGTSHLLAFEYLDIQADAPGHVRLMEVIVPSQA